VRWQPDQRFHRDPLQGRTLGFGSAVMYSAASRNVTTRYIRQDDEVDAAPDKSCRDRYLNLAVASFGM
jgi:hypothetical protein